MKTKIILQNIILIISCFIVAGCEQSSTSATDTAVERAVLNDNEYYKDFGNYTVNVNAFTTDQLSAEIAKSYDIGRSKRTVLLNIFVAKKNNEDYSPAVAEVKVLARNMSNQLKDIEMRSIKEETTLYYIGEISVANGETIIFDIDITPEGLTNPYVLSYRQQFFTE